MPESPFFTVFEPRMHYGFNSRPGQSKDTPENGVSFSYPRSGGALTA